MYICIRGRIIVGKGTSNIRLPTNLSGDQEMHTSYIRRKWKPQYLPHEYILPLYSPTPKMWPPLYLTCPKICDNLWNEGISNQDTFVQSREVPLYIDYTQTQSDSLSAPSHQIHPFSVLNWKLISWIWISFYWKITITKDINCMGHLLCIEHNASFKEQKLERGIIALALSPSATNMTFQCNWHVLGTYYLY